MGVRFVHTLRGLESDFRESASSYKVPASRAVRQVAHGGQMMARRLARRRGGTHGRPYARSITLERLAPLMYEWGPDASMDQGNMNFEEGPGPQSAPHPNMAQSSDGRADELANRLEIVRRGTWRV